MMCPLLTRNVFRRLLSNEPLRFRCPRTAYVAPSHNAFLPRRRMLFGFSRKPARKQPREPRLDPGLSKLLELTMMDKLRARPPPSQELAEAWAKFFKYKEYKKEAVNNHQARHALTTLKHLQKVDGVRLSGEEYSLKISALKHALATLVRPPPDNIDTHKQLAGELFEEIERRTSVEKELASSLRSYIRVLCHAGDSLRARDVYQPFLVKVSGVSSPYAKETWLAIMQGFVREDNEPQLLQTFHDAPSGAADTKGATLNKGATLLVIFYDRKNNVEATKEWCSYLMRSAGGIQNPTTLSTILQFSIRNSEQQWATSIFKTVIDSGPTKAQWDVVFQWAAGSMGKGVEDVERMIEVMVRCGKEDDMDIRPDIVTINGLVGLAMSQKDPYLAERYISLGRKLGIEPDCKTHILQMDYRISAGDLTGASAAYQALQSDNAVDDSDVPVLNKYIRALCLTQTPNYELITTITDDLDKRAARLDPDTVSALCVLYLEYGETDLMIDILQVHSYGYTLDERAAVRDACLAYTLSPDTSTTHAWEAYQIFIHVFVETEIDIRTKAMREFFRRRRSDMALHVFGHMRAHDRMDRRPTLQTYVECFEGIASCCDKPSLDVVHNMLKMDSSIEPNTALYNSLMQAYAACGDSAKALRFWGDITNSREGPSYRSLELVFKACQNDYFGDVKAREIWEKMRKMEIEVTREVYVAYMGALAGHAKREEAQLLIENGEKEFGFPPDLMTIGMFYNAMPSQDRKDLIGEWAADLYPKVWADLEKLGQQEMKEGHRMFKLPGVELRDEPDEDDDEEEMYS